MGIKLIKRCLPDNRYSLSRLYRVTIWGEGLPIKTWVVTTASRRELQKHLTNEKPYLYGVQMFDHYKTARNALAFA